MLKPHPMRAHLMEPRRREFLAQEMVNQKWRRKKDLPVLMGVMPCRLQQD
jgi:hypothetical protein